MNFYKLIQHCTIFASIFDAIDSFVGTTFGACYQNPGRVEQNYPRPARTRLK
jgi:hypothetical protein